MADWQEKSSVHQHNSPSSSSRSWTWHGKLFLSYWTVNWTPMNATPSLQCLRTNPHTCKHEQPLPSSFKTNFLLLVLQTNCTRNVSCKGTESTLVERDDVVTASSDKSKSVVSWDKNQPKKWFPHHQKGNPLLSSPSLLDLQFCPIFLVSWSSNKPI